MSLDPIDMDDSARPYAGPKRSPPSWTICSRTLNDLGGLSVGVLAELLQERGTGVLMVLFALLLALPSGVLPGLNTDIRDPADHPRAQLALGRTYRLAAARRHKHAGSIPTHVRRVVGRLLPPLRRLEHFLKPRAAWLITGGGQRICSAPSPCCWRSLPPSRSR